ncbi:MAG TPA: DUF423 domain-containing protein [Flavobacteriaceae bacterium]|jgi:uncharacterized membrane protein YgdD (TMEM256/DUF423 family)
MNKLILVTASILGMVAILLGAFASHGLKELISTESIQTFETGVRYQMYHAIVLLFIGTTSVFSVKTKQLLYYLVVIGILFFSGSIYGLATNELSGFDFKSIGFITPIGGLLLIISWGIMLIKFLKLQTDK